MKLTIISRDFGTININSETYVAEYAATNTPIFQLVEYVFDMWYEKADQNLKHLYEVGAINRKGAVRRGIQALIDYMVECKVSLITTAKFYQVEFEEAFEPDFEPFYCDTEHWTR